MYISCAYADCTASNHSYFYDLERLGEISYRGLLHTMANGDPMTPPWYGDDPVHKPVRRTHVATGWQGNQSCASGYRFSENKYVDAFVCEDGGADPQECDGTSWLL